MSSASLFHRWRKCFTTGLAVILPVFLTFAVVKWIFGTVASFTDTLLFFLPRTITHADDGRGPMLWYWSVFAFALAVALTTLTGVLTRYYVGKKFVKWLDETMLSVPVMNKLYAAIKQVNDALTSGKKTAFKTVVLVEFPRPGMKALGLITNDTVSITGQHGQNLVGVFIPTTPNPTSGFIVLLPEDKITRLDIPVADAIKWVMSLGSLEFEARLADSTAKSAPAEQESRKNECPGQA